MDIFKEKQAPKGVLLPCFSIKTPSNMTDQVSIAEPKELSMAEIKEAYPNEWVLIGNPVMDEGNLNVLMCF